MGMFMPPSSSQAQKLAARHMAAMAANQQIYTQNLANVPLGDLLGQYQGTYSQDALRNAYAPPPQPKLNGETFVEWNARYTERVGELDASGMVWPWVEGQNWKADIDAWADLYGVEP